MREAPRYGKEFYRDRAEASRRSGEIILSLLMEAIPGIRSAVDLGCGTGDWLSVLRDKGVETIQGYDGPWVLETDALAIPRECFRPIDLNQPGDLSDRRYDLAISVEVGEHVQPANSPALVRSLTQLSDVVLFSAAVPGQGGTGHVNERWPSDWADLFDREGYETIDVLRGMIWDDDRLCFWYRQNVLLFLNRETKAGLIESLGRRARPPLSVIHPDLYLLKNKNAIPSVLHADVSARDALKLFLRCTGNAFRRRLPASKS
ncbi:hypothetical protein OJF2_03890 [Aquisphaera giovannonii]|uniref:Methyltransferase domain protein n=1 Tax=Aquisphaera giovannonii TaxID=406548 RepID=A0A5B9VUH0_9BACT|nr:methyltransferase domain-containing protein [Aquisphaera giovannonii]QEH31922.1 hypothetical protein OJF2_03890 [Aquisphaera giovannonii]